MAETLSAHLLVYNERALMQDWFDCHYALFDEIVIVLSGKTVRTET